MRKQLVLLVPLLACIVGYVLVVAFPAIRANWFLTGIQGPILDAPGEVHLGDREVGETAQSTFRIVNQGNADLILNDIRSSCTCLGIERVVDGKPIRVDSLRLGPKEQIELQVRISVRGQAGKPSVTPIAYRTNDPVRPESVLNVIISKVKGGLLTTPTSVSFGTVPSGSGASQKVIIRDEAVVSRKIVRVLSSRPERFTARLLPLQGNADNASQPFPGKPIGCIEITLVNLEPGSIDGEIHVYTNERPDIPLAVPVEGRVAPVVEILPSSLVLPRQSDQGPIYFGTFICRSTEGKACDVKLESAPTDLQVTITDIPESNSTKTVRVEWKKIPDAPTTDLSAKHVRLSVHVGERSGTPVTLEIPVFCREKP